MLIFPSLLFFGSCYVPDPKMPNLEIFNFGRHELEEKVKSFDGLVVVDFQAPWCIDCKILHYYMGHVIKNNPDVLFLMVDVDKVPNIRNDFQIFHIPDVRFYRGDLNQLSSIVEGRAQDVQVMIEKLKNKDWSFLYFFYQILYIFIKEKQNLSYYDFDFQYHSFAIEPFFECCDLLRKLLKYWIHKLLNHLNPLISQILIFENRENKCSKGHIFNITIIHQWSEDDIKKMIEIC